MKDWQLLLKDCQPFQLVDAGSRNGFHQFSWLHPSSHYWGFDPISDSQLASNQFISHKLIASALDAKAGEADFYCYAHPSMSSLLEFDEARFKQHFGLMENSATWLKQFQLMETRRVQLKCLDDFFLEEKLKQIDFLKLDTQGSELAILKGAETLLSQKKINLIACEVAFVPVYKNQALYHQLAEYLANFNFQLANLSIYPQAMAQWGNSAENLAGFREKIRFASGGDALFYRSDLEGKEAHLRTGILLAANGIYSLARKELQLGGIEVKQLGKLFHQLNSAASDSRIMGWKEFIKLVVKQLFG